MTGFPGHWDDGSDTTAPEYQLHWYDEGTAALAAAGPAPVRIERDHFVVVPR